jgi:hypothetical protein
VVRSRYCEINCDLNLSPDCREYAGPERTMKALIDDARKAGWHIGPVHAEEDACPECRKAQSDG